MKKFSPQKTTCCIYITRESISPHEETARILAKYINEDSRGKLDIVDYEAWTLRRYFLQMQYQRKEDLEKGIVYFRTSSLNHALEASMQKNSQTEIK